MEILEEINWKKKELLYKFLANLNKKRTFVEVLTSLNKKKDFCVGFSKFE